VAIFSAVSESILLISESNFFTSFLSLRASSALLVVPSSGLLTDAIGALGVLAPPCV